MGWNSWNTFGWNISEELIKTTADFFVESGLKDAGYEYIVIDDCWSEKKTKTAGWFPTSISSPTVSSPLPTISIPRD